jgi:signal transduction histidine kinase
MELSKRLAGIAIDSRKCTTQVRNLMNDLRPTVLDDLGLYAAVSEHIAELSETVPFEISLQFDHKLQDWRSRSDALLFRLIQEALLNIRKHASANNVTIEFKTTKQNALLHINDDGSGFDPNAAVHGHYGLLTMRERAEALGGQLAVESEPGWGTQITVVLPLDASQ